ncbi:MAG: hypothetical protein AB4050_06690 [Synechococcus sp.]
MSNYLSNLVARNLGLAETVKPRPIYRFESVPGLAGSGETEKMSWEQQAGAVTSDQIELAEISEEQISTTLSVEQLGNVLAHQPMEQPLSSQLQEQMISSVTKRQASEEKSEEKLELPEPFASLEPPTGNSQVTTSQPRAESELIQPPASEDLLNNLDRQQHSSTVHTETSIPILNGYTPKATKVRPKQSSPSLEAEAIEGGETTSSSGQQSFTPARKAQTIDLIVGSSAIQSQLTVPKPTSIQPTTIKSTSQPQPFVNPLSEPIVTNLVESDPMPALTPMPRPAKTKVEVQPQTTSSVKQVTTASGNTVSKNSSFSSIEVTIGRIEVRVTPPPVSPQPKSRCQSPVMSLDEYLRQRAQGDNR